jgi:hypothetical protein
MSDEVWTTRFDSNALIWWRESGQHLFPRLALMAKDYFSAQGVWFPDFRVPGLTRVA